MYGEHEMSPENKCPLCGKTLYSTYWGTKIECKCGYVHWEESSEVGEDLVSEIDLEN